MARLIEELPERTEFSDTLDSDGFSDDKPVIRLQIIRNGQRVCLDFTGTSPQTRGPINFPLNGTMLKTIFYRTLRGAASSRVPVDPYLEGSQGAEELIDVVIPEGCLLRPVRPAPVGLRHLTVARMHDVLRGALAKLFPEAIPACGAPGAHHVAMGQERGQWLAFEVTPGSDGARPFADGLDAFYWNTRIKNVPAEVFETTFPIRVEKYALRVNSAGAGKYRGGYGVVRVVRALRPCSLFYAGERHQSAPWGLSGGKPGQSGAVRIERANGDVETLPGKFDAIELDKDDLLVVETGGGGGWGPPDERDAQVVLGEVRRGLLTADQARSDYGVVIDGDAIDLEATTSCRASLKQKRGP